MDYKIDRRGNMGFKELSPADLGTGSSHQTHIGLFSDVLEHLGNSEIIPSSILLYRNRGYHLDCYFDRIQNPDGSFRSPKIRKGKSESIVRKIREFANKTHETLYLVWFGLEDRRIVFFLISNTDAEFSFIINNLGEVGVHEISYKMSKFFTEKLEKVLKQQ